MRELISLIGLCGIGFVFGFASAELETKKMIILWVLYVFFLTLHCVRY